MNEPHAFHPSTPFITLQYYNDLHLILVFFLSHSTGTLRTKSSIPAMKISTRMVRLFYRVSILFVGPIVTYFDLDLIPFSSSLYCTCPQAVISIHSIVRMSFTYDKCRNNYSRNGIAVTFHVDVC